MPTTPEPVLPRAAERYVEMVAANPVRVALITALGHARDEGMTISDLQLATGCQGPVLRKHLRELEDLGIAVADQHRSMRLGGTPTRWHLNLHEVKNRSEHWHASLGDPHE